MSISGQKFKGYMAIRRAEKKEEAEERQAKVVAARRRQFRLKKGVYAVADRLKDLVE